MTKMRAYSFIKKYLALLLLLPFVPSPLLAEVPEYQQTKLSLVYKGKTHNDKLCAVLSVEGIKAKIIFNKQKLTVEITEKDVARAQDNAAKNQAIYQNYLKESQKGEAAQMRNQQLEKEDKKTIFLKQQEGLVHSISKKLLPSMRKMKSE